MTRQQKWAKHAYERVIEHKAKEGDKDRERREKSEKKYATLCMKAPSLVQQAGLVQALAFLRTRSEEGKALVDELARGIKEGEDGAKLQQRAHAAPLADYMALTQEVIALAAWFRRFAQAELKSEES